MINWNQMFQMNPGKGKVAKATEKEPGDADDNEDKNID